MKVLELHTGLSTVHLEDNTTCIYVVEYKIAKPRVKHIGIPDCFLQKKLDNGTFVPKYDKYSTIPSDMFTKPSLGPIIS